MNNVSQLHSFKEISLFCIPNSKDIKFKLANLVQASHSNPRKLTFVISSFDKQFSPSKHL